MIATASSINGLETSNLISVLLFRLTASPTRPGRLMVRRQLLPILLYHNYLLRVSSESLRPALLSDLVIHPVSNLYFLHGGLVLGGARRLAL